MFLAEINGLEVVRDNQKTFELSPSFTPSAIDVHGSLVAVGGEVCCFHCSCSLQTLIPVTPGCKNQVIRLGWQVDEGVRSVRRQQGSDKRDPALT